MTILTRPEGTLPQDLHLSRRGAAALFFAGYAVAALSAQAEPISTSAEGLIIETATLAPSDGFHLAAYVARPRARGRFPAILVNSEIFGVHDYIKDVCRRLAHLGYVAIAPAYFTRVGDPAPLSDFPAIMKIVQAASDPQVMGDVAAALAWLKAQPFVAADHIGVTGFCWGGGVTWLACETFPELRAGVVWYGKMVRPAGAADDPRRFWPAERAKDLHCPVLAFYGAKDPLSQGVETMREALAAAGKARMAQIIVYPDAGHGFHADYRASYNAADAADAWSRLKTFFAAHGLAPRAFTPTA
ncbi:MAG: dienelactone hydrolase family protein [Alphaproteobacteria bacterium]|jgi:carboxymethylenebutenolidase|nr:dienelactone hydrolase family protein [Alphaproteobacteria bacterium]